MKNTTAERRLLRGLGPMQVAWGLALGLFLVVAAVLAVFPQLRQSVIVVEPAPKPDPAELERRRAQIKKPEPTEKQVKEIAERVERKKKQELREKVRQLEKNLEDIREAEDMRHEALGLEAVDVFAALITAIRKKAELVEQSGELREQSRTLRGQADGLAAFENGESPGLQEAAVALRGAVAAHEQALRTRRDSLEPHDTYHRTRAERVVGHAVQMGGLVERLIRTLPGGAADAGPVPEDALQAMTAAELFDEAARLDDAIRQEFADARAAELAAVQDQPLAEALAQVDVPEAAPVPAGLPGALAAGEPSSREEFQQYNQALEQAAQAAGAMELAAQGMAAQARGFNAQGESREAAQATRLQQAMRSSAAAAAPGAVVDLTPMMRDLYGLQRGGPSGESGNSGRLDATSLMAGGEGTQMGQSTAESAGRALPLRDHQIIPQLLPGRKFSRSSGRRGWLYIDTWYVIGPFQKPDSDRLSFATRFPPETRIDLDGEYAGKIHPQTGRPLALRWRFFQSNTLRITPPDEIDGSVYYAWTEVYFEEDEEVLVAVASDDAAKVWINDLVVWEDTGLSAWRVDEGFRKVLFRKGYNSVLVRIENGPVVCMYSLLFCPVGLER